MNNPLYIRLSEDRSLDLYRGVLMKGGIRISLSQKEVQLLSCLAQHIGQPVSQGVIIDRLWGGALIPIGNLLYQCVHRLREVLEDDPHKPRFLTVVKRRGYMLNASEFTNI